MIGHHLTLTDQHRVIVNGVALRFFLRADDAWTPVTDTEFHQRLEEALFDPDALRKDVLCPNARRVELDRADYWLWSDGSRTAGLCTFHDREPQDCAGVSEFLDGALH